MDSLTNAEKAVIKTLPLGNENNKKNEYRVHIYFSCEPRYEMYDENGGHLTKPDFYNKYHTEHVMRWKHGKNPVIGYKPPTIDVEKETEEMKKPENKFKKPKRIGLYDKQILIDCSDIAYDSTSFQCKIPDEKKMLEKLDWAIRVLKCFCDLESAFGYYGDPVKLSVGATSPLEPIMLALLSVLKMPIDSSKTAYCQDFIGKALDKFKDTFKYYTTYHWKFQYEYGYIIEYYISYQRLRNYTWEIGWLESEIVDADIKINHDYRWQEQRYKLRDECRAKGLKDGIDFPTAGQWELTFLGQEYWDHQWGGRRTNNDYKGTWEFAGFYTLKELKELLASVKAKDAKKQYEKTLKEWEKKDTFEKLGTEVYNANKDYIDTFLSNTPKIYEMTKVMTQIEEQRKTELNPYSMAYAQGQELAMLSGDQHHSVASADYDGQFYSAFDLDIQREGKKKEIEQKEKKMKDTYERAMKAGRAEIKREYLALRMGIGFGSIILSPLALIDATFEIIDMVQDGVSWQNVVNLGFDLVGLIPLAGGVIRASAKGITHVRNLANVSKAEKIANIKSGLLTAADLEKQGFKVSDKMRFAEEQINQLKLKESSLTGTTAQQTSELQSAVAQRDRLKKLNIYISKTQKQGIENLEKLLKRNTDDLLQIKTEIRTQQDAYMNAFMATNKKVYTIRDFFAYSKNHLKSESDWSNLWHNYLIKDIDNKWETVDLFISQGTNLWTAKGIIDNSIVLRRGIDYEGIMYGE